MQDKTASHFYSRGEGSTLYNGLYGAAQPESGTFIRLRVKEWVGKSDEFRFLGNYPPTPSFKLTLTLTSHLGQNGGLGGGVGGQFPTDLN